jgi:phage FluMu protein Com
MNEPKSAKMQCNHCHKVIKYPADRSGQKAKCPGCREEIELVDQTRRQEVKTTSEGTISTVPPATQPPPLPTVVSSPISNAKDELASTALMEDRRHRDSKIATFISDGQSVATVAKLLSRVTDICTNSEQPEYIAVQHLPGVLSPDAIVLTNKRVIIFRAKALGRMKMLDVQWLDVQNIRIQEGMLGAAISVTGVNGHSELIDKLPKAQARAVYRVGQEREEIVREHRRDRKMEEERNAAGGVVVNANIGGNAPPNQPVAPSDPMVKLQQLKTMLENDLISQAEFDAKKTDILASM